MNDRGAENGREAVPGWRSMATSSVVTGESTLATAAAIAD
jgi:hypothetical protein